MKPILSLLVAGLIVGWVSSADRAVAEVDFAATVTIHARSDFYAPLAAEGTWITVGSYGRCWRPAHVTVEWRPYCVGHWVWTDCGWYWESDEPWAWACYHYGRWVDDPDDGWIWIPDVEWAPAWVSWRVGGGYIGWAPLPPAGWLFEHHPPRPAFVFVGASHFEDPVRPATVIVNTALILPKTRAIQNPRRETRRIGDRQEKVVVDNGPGVGVVEKATGRKLNAVPIGTAIQRTQAARPAVRETVPRQRPNSAFAVPTQPGPKPAPKVAPAQPQPQPERGQAMPPPAREPIPPPDQEVAPHQPTSPPGQVHPQPVPPGHGEPPARSHKEQGRDHEKR